VTATVTFECDYCGREAVCGLGDSPLGWWSAPRKGRGDGDGHACAECIMECPEVYDDVIARRDRDTRRILGEDSPPDVEQIPIT
jgi:hypothetical protein